MRTTYLIRDRSTSGLTIMGTATLKPEYGPTDILRLANSGQLFLQAELSNEESAAIKREQEKNEQAQEEIQKKADEEAERLPDKSYELADLTGKQLKAICKKRGLETTGNKFDLIDRIEKAGPEEKKAKKKAK